MEIIKCIIDVYVSNSDTKTNLYKLCNEKEIGITFDDLTDEEISIIRKSINKLLLSLRCKDITKSKNYNLDKYVYHGWKVKDFIDVLSDGIGLIMIGNSWKAPFTSKQEIIEWCKHNQPFYKEEIPEVINYFADKYNIKD